jgi:hypothetical protein
MVAFCFVIRFFIENNLYNIHLINHFKLSRQKFKRKKGYITCDISNFMKLTKVKQPQNKLTMHEELYEINIILL